jgi:hypothetical protein
VALTRLYDGPLTSFGVLSPDPALDKYKLAEWYRAWWKNNEGKEVILTRVRQTQIKARFIEVCRQVEVATADPDHSLHGFTAPDEKLYHCVGEALFAAGYVGSERGRRALIQPGEKFGQGSVWLMVRDQFPLLKGIPGWNQPFDPIAQLPKDAKLVYQEPIANTPWHIEIYVRDVTIDEESALQKRLKEPPATADKK